MPPRYSYWTIVAGGLPTAFRAAERDELLPTFRRIQEKHPDAEMKYFARGRLWASQDEARAAADARRSADRRPESRGRDWRPGGEHHDPRQKFKDAKKERNLDWRKQRFERRQQSGAAVRPANPNRPPASPARPDWRDRPPRSGKPQGPWQNRPPREGAVPPAGKPQRPWQNRPPREKPHGDPVRRPATRPFARNRFERNQSPDEPQPPRRPKEPDRQTKPGEASKPAPPPTPTKPAFRPPGPPERGRRGGGPIKDRRRRS